MPPFLSAFYQLRKRLLHDTLPKMRCLRVLALREYWTTYLPESIGNLTHLRYLDLSFTPIDKLPESVCCLYNLQTMILTGCRDLTELPSRMGDLINLRYIDLVECNSLKEMATCGIGRLTSLQRLIRFVVGQIGEDRLGELGQLSQIRGTLFISNMNNVVSIEDAARSKIGNKRHLDNLILEWEQNGESLQSRNEGITQQQHDEILNKLQPHPDLEHLSIRQYPGVRFPDWVKDPSVLNNLVSFELRGDCCKCSTLPPLGNLTHLKDLYISGMSEVKSVGSEFYGNGSFESLKTLSFEDMEKWEVWLCSGELFPQLLNLFVLNCPKLTGKVPEHLASLQELEIDKCSHLVMASVTVNSTIVRKLKMVDFGKLQVKMPNYELVALQTSKIEISDVCQWKQLQVAPTELLIRKCDAVESLLEEEILETNIQDLKISDCSFSRSLQNVGLPSTKLKEISISNCSKLEFLLPALFGCPLPVLQQLHIHGGLVEDNRSLTLTSLCIFPQLASFVMRGVEGLEKLSISIPDGEYPLTSLHFLDISRCPNLESVELHALKLDSCKIGNCTLRPLVLRHSSIKELKLRDCPVLLFSQRDIFPSQLSKLVIRGGCKDMESFPKDYCVLPSNSLTSIEISDLPNLKTLDCRGLQHLASLENLKIMHCPILQSWKGEGLHHLTSLQKLSIIRCPKLKYLTKKRLPPSLSVIWIYRCPLLEKRCQFEKGAEWPYISHIPEISIDGELY